MATYPEAREQEHRAIEALLREAGVRGVARERFLSVVVQQQTYAEIAQEEGVTEHRVRCDVSRARVQMLRHGGQAEATARVWVPDPDPRAIAYENHAEQLLHCLENRTFNPSPGHPRFSRGLDAAGLPCLVDAPGAARVLTVEEVALILADDPSAGLGLGNGEAWRERERPTPEQFRFSA